VAIAKKDILVGVALIILAVIYWLGADALPKSILGGGIGADALPKLLGIALGILSLALVLQTIFAGRAGSDGAVKDQPFDYRTHLRALGLLCIGIGYVVLVETIGYIPAIAYLLGAVALYVGGASRRMVVAFAVIGALFFWTLFVGILDIRQPKGFWPELWKQIQAPQSQAAAPDAVSHTAV
jgi:putative tricarboxylic transport membrane protein